MASIGSRAPTAGHTRGRREALEQLLARQWATVEVGRERLREGGRTESSEVRDAEEHAVDGMERGVNVALLELCSRAAHSIEAALVRLKVGAFGRCADCGRRIAAQRLQAVSFAERCCRCQRACDVAVERTVYDTRADSSPRRARVTSGH